METTTIIKRAKVLNYIEIAVTVALFILFRALNTAASTVTTQEELDRIISIQTIGLVIAGGVSIVVIVMTALLMKKNEKRVKGLGLLLAAGIVTLVFAIIQMMMGLIIWILCGISLKQLSQKDAEDSFEAKLSVEISAGSDDESAEEAVVEAAAEEVAEETSEN